MPREKYLPLLSVFRLYFWPLSWFCQVTAAFAIGVPDASLHTPCTVPFCANAGIAAITDRNANKTATTIFLFIRKPPGWAAWKFALSTASSDALFYRNVRQRIDHTRVMKCQQPQNATIADSAGAVFAAVTRPR